MTPVGTLGNDLTVEEVELILRALGYFQVHLVDKQTKAPEAVNGIGNDIRNATSAIKKMHRIYEGLAREVR